MSASVLGRLLRRDRILTVGGLSAAIVLSWAYLLAGAGMDMPDMAGMLMPAEPVAWTAGYVGILVVMWAVMMAAMMLPGAAPTILLYEMIVRRRTQTAAAAGAGMFALGYVAVWVAFSGAAVVLQYALAEAALLSPGMKTTSVVAAGGVLVAAGAYQWTPWKHACLRRCRSPLEFLLMHWRRGTTGAFAMGLRHGAFCVGCCWVLMLLLFVGGVMNIGWVAGIAVYVFVEKVVPAGVWVGRIAGAGLVLWGAAILSGF